MIIASVIIPTYNYAGLIVIAIDSVLSQSYPAEKIEIIVVDDGSTDNTKEVLQSYVNSNKIKYFFQENRGKANATSVAISKTTGKYIFNLDADDYFHTDKILRSVEVFESDDSIVHVASPATILKEQTHTTDIEKIPAEIVGKVIDGDWLLKYFYTQNILFGGGTTFAARASVLKAATIPDGIDMYIDEFLIVAILPFGKSFFFKEPLSVWRVHGKNYSVGKVTKENTAYKNERLLKSSAQMLAFLKNQHYDPFVIKTYHLKDITGRIAFKESADTKNIPDILSYGYKVFFVLRPRWVQIKKYHVINRLVPTSLFRLLKRFKKQD